MLGKWVKRSGDFKFLQLTEKESMDIVNRVLDFNDSVMRNCIARADKIVENGNYDTDDTKIKIALALFDKSAIASFSVMRSELDKPSES
jgi:hypothetical protein